MKIDFIMRMVMYMFAHYMQCEISPILFFISVTIKLNSMKTANKLVYSKVNYYTENGYEYKIKTTISLDDDCHNNMCDWSITADIRWKNKYGIYKEYMGGCCRVHDAASGLWSGSSMTGGLRRADAGQTVIVIGACKRKVLCRS